MKAKKPEMIIFDYGHTLLYEPGYDPVGGMSAVLELVESGKPVSELAKPMSDSIEAMLRLARSGGIEVHSHMLMRAVLEQYGIETSVPFEQLETAYWEGLTPGVCMPGIDKLLDCMARHSIRSAVISNIPFSQTALAQRINSRLPKNNFEFFIASAEYAFKKPSRVLFDIALRKAKLPPEKVWYCGDSANADVRGASGAGIFPVWYDNPIEGNFRPESQTAPPDLPPHLHINEWQELIDILKIGESIND